ncbi:MAG: ATP synthase subunit I [Alphaproteobacteria bacterium]|nr:ATP synthase subunit I [Alphaproteobacteria bacterium]
MQALTMPSGWEAAALAAAGVGLGAAYLCLLWQTIRILPRIRYKQAFLSASKIVRIALLLFPMVALARSSVVRLLIIFAFFWLTRLVVLYIARGKNA